MPRKWLTRPGYLSPEFSSHRKAPKASFEEICLKSRLGAGQDGQRSPLNPALSRQRQADLSVSSRPTRSTKQVPGRPGLLHRQTLS